MPVSVDSTAAAAAVITSALRDSFQSGNGGGPLQKQFNSSSSSIGGGTNKISIISGGGDNDSDDNLKNRLVASAKRVLMQKIEYEEVNNYNQTILEQYKSKYIVLKPFNNNNNGTSVTSSGKLILQHGGGGDDKDNSSSSTIISIAQQNGQKHINNNNNSNSNNNHNNPTELPKPKKILFPRENVQIGWRSSNRKWQIGAGMINVGNTCYLNSTLQAIYHVPAMANWLISDSHHREKCEDETGAQDGCIICAMAKTVISSQTNQSAIRPWLVYSKLRSICKHLIMGRQEDAHEFLRYLVEAMEKSYLSRFRNNKELDQYSKETTPLNQILGGYLRSAVRCLACGHVSTTFQHFQDLLLDIRKANTIEEALDGYFARERLEDMGYKCEACKKKVSATKQFSLERSPISLCIQLKRFSMMGTKLNKHIQIKPRLDLTKYSSKKTTGESLSYKLVAMVTHLGASQHCGHYTAIGCTDGGGYYQFDDSCVRPISMQNVLNTNAYIIFYELEQPTGKQTSTQVSGSLDADKTKENSSNNNFNGHSNTLISRPLPSNNNISTNYNVKSNATARIIGPQLPEHLQNGNKQIFVNNSQNFTKTNGENGFKSALTANKLINNFKNGQNIKFSDISKTEQSAKLVNSGKTENHSNSCIKKIERSNTLNENNEILKNSPCKTLPSSNLQSNSQPNSKNLNKSLVPSYDSDESDDEATAEKKNHLFDCNEKKRRHSVDSSDGECSSPESKRSKSTEPTSPYCVETKAGIWKVTSLNKSSCYPSTSAKIQPLNTSPIKSSSAITSEKKLTNPFNNNSSTSISTLNFYSNNKTFGKKESKDPTVNELLKYSHRGYGAPVINWNGHKTDMEREITEENRLERKREIQAGEENEMDRGRQKKVKMYNHNNNRDITPGFNPFQEMQRKNNHDQQRRWIPNGNNSGRYQNQHSNNHHFNRNHHSNFRRHNKFNPTNHYQRKWR